MYKIIASALALSSFFRCGATSEVCGTWSLELLFMQDLSSSFRDDMVIFRQVAPVLLSELATEFPGARFGFSSFIDKPYYGLGSSTDYCYKLHTGLTTDQSVVLNNINTAALGSGGDFSESQLDGLWHGLKDTEVGWSSGDADTAGNPVLRAFILLTDADYHVNGDAAAYTAPFEAIPDSDCTAYDYPTLDAIAAAINSSKAKPIFLVNSTSGNNYDAAYQVIVDRVGHGTVQPLDGNSANIVEAVKNGIAEVSCQTTTAPPPTPAPPVGSTPEDEGTPTAVIVGAAVGGMAAVGAAGAGAVLYYGGSAAVVPEMAVESALEAPAAKIPKDQFVGVGVTDFS
eukprot:Lankesteria_metandrocarpae@DN93_c0_g1_i1.p1